MLHRHIQLVWIVTLWTLTNGRLQVPGLPPNRYKVPGDINIGVMVDVSYAGDRAKDQHCLTGTIRMIAVHMCETVIYAMKQINQRYDLLPNTTLGIICLDSCDNPLSALARSVYLVPDHPPDTCYQNKTMTGEDSTLELEHQNVVGVIGPIHSQEIVLMSSFMGVFQIPIVGTHTTSEELSDKSIFEYFIGLSIPDKFQAQLMINLISYFNWTYVGLFYTEGSYGEFGAKRVQKLVAEHELCLAFSYRISSTVIEKEAEEALDLLKDNPNLKVIIWFAEGEGMKYVFGEIAKEFPQLGAVHLLSYFSSYLRVRYPRETRGSFSVKQVTAPVPGFLDYINSLIPGKNTNNPWLKQRWQDTFDCDWESASNNSCLSYRADRKWYGNYPINPPYYDATYLFAHALHQLILHNCPEAFNHHHLLEDCIQGQDLLNQMKNVSFQGVAGEVSFDENGDRLGRFGIYQRVDLADGKMATEYVGYWDAHEDVLEMLDEKLDLGFLKRSNDSRSGVTKLLDQGKELFVPYSVCSWPCGPHEFLLQKKVPCCWECHTCRDNEVVVNGTTCEQCPPFTWPDSEYQAICTDLEPRYLLWNEPTAIALTCMSLFGISIVLVVTIIFWRKRHIKLIKASNKELSFILLLGGFLAFVSALFFIIQPSDWSCILRHLGFNLSVNLLYVPMFMKTLTVYRIFYYGRKGLQRPRMVSAMAQLCIVFLIFFGQVIILVIVNSYQHSELVFHMPVLTSPYVELACTQPLVPFILPLSYNVIFILICAILGYASRKLPENFNESGFIFMSVSTTLFAWVVFLPTYFTASHTHQQMAILSLCLLLNAYITVGCLFGPKVYAVYFVDEDSLRLVQTTKAMGSVMPSASMDSYTQNEVSKY